MKNLFITTALLTLLSPSTSHSMQAVAHNNDTLGSPMYKIPNSTFQPISAYESATHLFNQNAKEIKPLYSNGNTFLHLMVTEALRTKKFNASLITITALLERGLDPHIKNHAGQTPIDLAQNCVILKQLLTTQKPNKESLMLLALKHKNEELVASLL